MHRRTAVLLGGLFVALAACSDKISTPVTPEAATALRHVGAQENAVRDHYIVVMKKGTSPRAAAAAVGASPRFVYQAALNGFAAKLNAAQVAALQNNPHVELVEPDGVMTISGVQSYPTWGLDRIDQRYRPLDYSFTYNRTGAGVNLYVLDTGIRTTHTEFGGRASVGYDVIGDGYNGQDCNGHGTHVAGTAGGTTYGVAKGVNLISVRVLDCYSTGWTSGVIAGVDWVTANHVGPSVANMSLGGEANSALDQAVRNSIASGVTYVIAAGNDGADACDYSPARVTDALIVGNSTSSDARASGSNYGPCLDLFAPGTSITSAYNGSDTQTAALSGTSMAAPHVAGVAALYLEYIPGSLPVDVQYAIVQNATNSVISNAGANSPDRLLYSGFIPPATTPLSITVSCYAMGDYCEASATGGSGGGYSFQWTNAVEQYDAGGYSWSYVYCGGGNLALVSATVTDGSGATATGSDAYNCGHGPGKEEYIP